MLAPPLGGGSRTHPNGLAAQVCRRRLGQRRLAPERPGALDAARGEFELVSPQQLYPEGVHEGAGVVAERGEQHLRGPLLMFTKKWSA